jgi:hypothetical protein
MPYIVWCSAGCIGALRANRFSRRRAPPTRDELQGLLDNIIARLMKMLTRKGCLVEEKGMTYLADIDADKPLASLQAASCTYRIAFGPRAGQKVLSLHTVASREGKNTAAKEKSHGTSCAMPLRFTSCVRPRGTGMVVSVPLQIMSASNRHGSSLRHVFLEGQGANRGREQGLFSPCRFRIRDPLSFLP